MQTLLKKNSCLSLTFSQSNGQAFQDNYRVLLEEKEEKIVFRPNDLVKVLNTASFGLIFNGDIEMAWPCNAKVQCIHFYNSFWNHLKTQRTHLFLRKQKLKKAISIKTTKMQKSRTHYMQNGPSRKFFMLYFIQTSEETLKVCEMMTSHYFLPQCEFITCLQM